MINNKIVITIPIYSLVLKGYELKVLDNLSSLCKEYEIYFIHPKSLSLDKEEPFIRYNFKSLAFDETYFKNIEGYNRLCLSYSFYDSFNDFDYLLIHQLDAFIFEKRFEKWISQNYDYVAPPWVGVDSFKFIRGTFENNVPLLLKAKLLPLHRRLFGHDFLVGNGGISLRKVRTFKRVLKIFDSIAREWPYNEDLFYSLYVPAYYPIFRIPSFDKALTFGFDLNPQKAFELNNNELPMAAHGFDKPAYLSKWQEVMETAPHSGFQAVLKSIKDE